MPLFMAVHGAGLTCFDPFLPVHNSWYFAKKLRASLQPSLEWQFFHSFMPLCWNQPKHLGAQGGEKPLDILVAIHSPQHGYPRSIFGRMIFIYLW